MVVRGFLKDTKFYRRHTYFIISKHCRWTRSKTNHRSSQTELTTDREQVKDVIFLPATREELIQDLLR